ncbi:retrovirus-related pol polyprotein from transposon TNT 1-94 [Tanacetum coccineum]|uniref:Retrovirus-related pol polyprotein from transposon TNT 1-94 n=1 Tax=Tanacetum coccineum TaxID=301880 RepID=A0ABQ4WHU7_9ASTR
MIRMSRNEEKRNINIQYSLDDEEDTRSSQEYMNDLEEEYQARTLLAKSKRFYKKGAQRFSDAKATDQTKCHKCGRNGHLARDYEEEVSSDNNEEIEVKALMAHANEERVYVGKESASNVLCQKTIKSILKLNYTFKDETLKGVTLKELSSAPAKDNRKGTSASKTYSAPAGKLKNVKIEDDPPLATMMKELNDLKLQLNKNKSSYSENYQS